MAKLNRSILAGGLIMFSAATTLGGLITLSAFESAPGEFAAGPTVWPRAGNIKAHGDRPELLVYAHPFCACTNATISELARLEAARPAYLPVPAVTVIVFRPTADSAWQRTSLELRAARMRDVRFVWDDGGIEAKSFGATTSGTVMLYGADGKLQFRGGITGSRGHEGENFGLSELRALLVGTPRLPTAKTSKVFGCALWNRPASRTMRLDLGR
jgi:hypothetical protein